MDRLLRLETPLVTTEFVLLEVADALCTPVSRIQTIAFINSLRVLKVCKSSLSTKNCWAG
ncbi:MAG: hypothetical protein V7K22_16825 [Nostoc sp.]|uniref:hypothetical protein n=1 Tax=Nostoc sp. TaxID=1180 RepID=UPI002FFB89B1